MATALGTAPGLGALKIKTRQHLLAGPLLHYMKVSMHEGVPKRLTY